MDRPRRYILLTLFYLREVAHVVGVVALERRGQQRGADRVVHLDGGGHHVLGLGLHARVQPRTLRPPVDDRLVDALVARVVKLADGHLSSVERGSGGDLSIKFRRP
eukprot:2768358-Pyramimonas_sp.AAC.1